MAKSLSPTRRYVLAAGFGALAGGLLVVFVIGAVPRAISGLMAGDDERDDGTRGGGRGTLARHLTADTAGLV